MNIVYTPHSNLWSEQNPLFTFNIQNIFSTDTHRKIFLFIEYLVCSGIYLCASRIFVCTYACMCITKINKWKNDFVLCLEHYAQYSFFYIKNIVDVMLKHYSHVVYDGENMKIFLWKRFSTAIAS